MSPVFLTVFVLITGLCCLLSVSLAQIHQHYVHHLTLFESFKDVLIFHCGLAELFFLSLSEYILIRLCCASELWRICAWIESTIFHLMSSYCLLLAPRYSYKRLINFSGHHHYLFFFPIACLSIFIQYYIKCSYLPLFTALKTTFIVEVPLYKTNFERLLIGSDIPFSWTLAYFVGQGCFIEVVCLSQHVDITQAVPLPGGLLVVRALLGL